MKYIIYELKLFLKSKLFFLSLLLTSLCFFIGIYGNKIAIEMDKGLSIFFSGFGFSPSAILPVLVPLIVALPMADSYLKDKDNKMVNAIFSRETKAQYFRNKYIAVGLSGSISIMIPLTILLIGSFLIFPQKNQTNLAGIHGAFSSVYHQNQLLYAVIMIINSGIFGFIYANIGFVSSLFFNNKYLCVFFPLLLYTIPSFIFPFLGLDRYEPVVTFDVTSNTTSTIGVVYLQFAFLLIITFYVGLQRIQKHD